MLHSHTSVLLRQWVERVGSTCSASVSVVQGKSVDTSGDFIVAMEQTLATGKDVDLSGVGLTIFDEAHHAPCNFLRLALRVPCLLLGLSAILIVKDTSQLSLVRQLMGN